MKEETSSQTSVVRLHFREDIREPSSKPSLPVLTPRRDVLGLPRARRAVAWIWGILPSLRALPEPDPRGSPPRMLSLLPRLLPPAPLAPSCQSLAPGAVCHGAWPLWFSPPPLWPPLSGTRTPQKRRNALDCLVGKLSQEPTQWSRQLVDSSQIRVSFQTKGSIGSSPCH